jgi:hypothetical protein
MNRGYSIGLEQLMFLPVPEASYRLVSKRCTMPNEEQRFHGLCNCTLGRIEGMEILHWEG